MRTHQQFLWVVEVQDYGSSEWDATTGAHFTRTEAREDQRSRWQSQFPRTRVVRYAVSESEKQK